MGKPLGKSTGPLGVEVRHTQTCKSRADSPCDCRPSVRAMVYDAKAEKLNRRSFNERGSGTTQDRINAALRWRLAAMQLVKDGKMRADRGQTSPRCSRPSCRGDNGKVLARSGKPYAPSTCLRMRQTAEFRVVPEWGARDPGDLSTVMVQRFVDQLVSDGVGASSVKNTLKPLSTGYRWALRRGDVDFNPCAVCGSPPPRGSGRPSSLPGRPTRCSPSSAQATKSSWGPRLLRRPPTEARRWACGGSASTSSARPPGRRARPTTRRAGRSGTSRERRRALRALPGAAPPRSGSCSQRAAKRAGPFVVGGQVPGHRAVERGAAPRVRPVGECRARADQLPREPPHLRVVDHRRGGQIGDTLTGRSCPG